MTFGISALTCRLDADVPTTDGGVDGEDLLAFSGTRPAFAGAYLVGMPVAMGPQAGHLARGSGAAGCRPTDSAPDGWEPRSAVPDRRPRNEVGPQGRHGARRRRPGGHNGRRLGLAGIVGGALVPGDRRRHSALDRILGRLVLGYRSGHAFRRQAGGWDACPYAARPPAVLGHTRSRDRARSVGGPTDGAGRALQTCSSEASKHRISENLCGN